MSFWKSRMLGVYPRLSNQVIKINLGLKTVHNQTHTQTITQTPQTHTHTKTHTQRHTHTDTHTHTHTQYTPID